MNKEEKKKNILDLKYQFEMQKINAILIMGSVGIISFIGTFIWYKERLFFGLFISLIIIAVSFLFYSRTKRRMKKILQEIENLTD